jgi:hypothetical protein
VDTAGQTETVVLLDIKGKLLPVSTFAFGVSSGPKRRVEQRYKDSLIIYRDGTVKKIGRINFLGYWGATFGRRMLSAINGGIRRVALDLTDQPQIKLDDIKSILRKGLAEDRKLAEPFFDASEPLPEVMRRIDTAINNAEIFDALQVPSPENALDILC